MDAITAAFVLSAADAVAEGLKARTGRDEGGVAPFASLPGVGPPDQPCRTRR